MLLVSWRGRRLGGLLILACVACVLWAAGLATQAAFHSVPLGAVFTLEMLRFAAWLVFFSVLLRSSASLSWFVRWGVHVAWAGALGLGLALEFLFRSGDAANGAGMVLVPAGLLLSLFCLILIEQIYRNASPAARWGLKYLCLGAGGLFAYDLFIYSQSMLLKHIDPELWNSRGIVSMLMVPALAIAARRNPDWSLEVFVSRHVVFYSATLIVVGLYLLLMALGGYYIRAYGGDWGRAAQAVFLFGAGMVLVVILFSGTLRARLKVFLSKHFYRNKYDYREEWLRLIGALSDTSEEAPLGEIAIRALAQIVGSPGGVLWLRENGESQFEVAARWQAPKPAITSYPPTADLTRFLVSRRWIIDLAEFRQVPDRYENMEIEAGAFSAAGDRLIVPLLDRDNLLGFVVLRRPDTPFSLTYEDTDLLRTVGKQIGGYLARDQAGHRIAENRQFEAYNRLVTFIMHDLKNLIAQQALVVSNAERHKHNPAFFEDAIATIANSVDRMNRLIEQLKSRQQTSPVRRLCLQEQLERVAYRCANRDPVPQLDQDENPLFVAADPERLGMVFDHLLRNAQDATPETGEILLSLRKMDGMAAVSVKDTGCGMESDFVQERLFKPFDSTKGSKGMGIGAYQAREYVRALGGDIKVDTSPGAGTEFEVKLPLSD